MEKSSQQYHYNINKKWKIMIRKALITLMAATLFTSVNANTTQTFVLGNYALTTDMSGPSADGTSKLTYPSGRTVYFSRTSTLTPANVVINWNGNHGSSSNKTNSLWCTQASVGTGNPLSIESGLISAGNYGGVDIFKTNITGLYFSLTIRSFSSNSMVHSSVPSITIQNGIMHQVLPLEDTNSNQLCQTTNTTGEINYKTLAGLGFFAAFTFYTDQTYTPGSSTITPLKTGDYHIRIWNENPGAGIKSHYDNVTFDISSVMVAEPTCTTQPVASGSSVSGTTVNLGSYSPNDIINGATAVPFSIKLAGCKGLRNINVTLASTTMATDTTLLGNILTLNHATGVGLEIRGAANNYSTETLIIPNESTSVYNDQRDTTNDDNIYGSSENGKVQTHTLNFLATLKRDSNQKIGSGNFKANAIFTIDYP